MKFLVYLCSVICSLKVCSGVMCYWCSGVGDDRDCEQHPYAVQTGPVFLNCRAHFCLSVKVIDADSGTVKSFARLCDNVPRDNVCIQDSKLLTCYESCTDDLCNNGNPDPDFLPITNYASEAPKQLKKQNGLKGNIFGQYSTKKEIISPYSHGRSNSEAIAMENARERLLHNAFRGTKSSHQRLALTKDDQMPRPNRNHQTITQASVNFTKDSVRFVTGSKFRATIKTSPINIKSTTQSNMATTISTSKSGDPIHPQTTPITTLSMRESTQDIPPNVNNQDLSEYTSKPVTSHSSFADSYFKISKHNDVHFKPTVSKAGVYGPNGKNYVQSHTIENNFGESSSNIPVRTTIELNTAQFITVEKSTPFPKLSKTRITTFRADLSSNMMTLKNEKTTKQLENSTPITQMVTLKKIQGSSIDSQNPLKLKFPLKSLIVPNNAVNLEKPVTAIGLESYDKLRGLEEIDEVENTFAFNSHPRNPDLPKHKHKKRKHMSAKQIVSDNGIVIWPMKDTAHEEIISNSIFAEDKEEALIQPYRINYTSFHPTIINRSTTTKYKPNNIRNDNATKPDIENTVKSSKNTEITPITPITTMSLFTRKSTFSLVSAQPLNPKRHSNMASTGDKTLLNKDLVVTRSINSSPESHLSKNIDNYDNEVKSETTTKPFSFWNHSTRQYASKLSDVWNEVHTTVIIEKQKDVPIPAEYPSFIEEDELIEYPAFENEVSGWKDPTEDLMLVAGYQDEGDESSGSSSRTIFNLIHVLGVLCFYIAS